MRVIFNQVHARNFRSFEDFTIRLDEGGVCLVQGKLEGDLDSIESNGAGKSSLFLAIAWALFGKFPHLSGRDVSGDDVVCWSRKEDCSVEVCYTIGEESYSVLRYRQHSDFKNKVRFFRGGEEKTLSSNSLTQRLIEGSLGISFDLFSQLVFITETSMKNSFSFETDSKRKQILIDVLPQLKQFGVARERVKDVFSTFSGFKDQLVRDEASYQQTLQTLPSTESIKEQLQTITDRVNVLESDLQNNYNEIEEIDHDLLSRRDLVQNIAASIEDAHDLCKNARAKKDEAQSKVFELRANLELATKNYEKWKNFPSVCPECEQPVPPEMHSKKMNEAAECVVDYKKEYKKQLDDLKDVGEAFERANAGLQELIEKQNRVVSNIHELEQKREYLVKRSAAINQELRSLHSTTSKLHATCDQIDATTRDLNLKLMESQYFLQTTQSYLDSLKYWLDGFGPRGVIAYALTQTLDLLTVNTNKWLHRLWHEGVSVVFEFPPKDASRISARLSYNGKDVNLTTLSSGQTRRLCLSICFGLRATLEAVSGWQTNLLVLDEVFDGLDNAGRMQVLREMQEIRDASIFVITQFPYFRGPVEKVINVFSKHGESYIGG